MATEFQSEAAALPANTVDGDRHHEGLSAGWSENWSKADAAGLYGLDRWSAGYFGISNRGNVTVKAPAGNQVASVELIEIVEGLRQRGLSMPVLLRLENLLVNRVQVLNQAFQRAIQRVNYRGKYRGVFPLKVNQQKHVIDQLINCGKKHGHGLEVGSKAELLIAMSSIQSRDSLIICNGFKDEEFVDLGLQLTQLGFQCFFVIEHLHELQLVLQRGQKWNIDPLMGVRVKLSTKVDGHWQNDSGDRSQFGLTTVQLIECLDLLRKAGMLTCLQLLHFHLGSQIPNIRNIRDGVHEACRYFIDLINEGANLKFIDLGGGLAVDYDGSSSNSTYSRNYDLDEYCIDIVETLQEHLDPAGVQHPTIVTESGRWTVAPSSILLFNILAQDHFDPIDKLDAQELISPSEPIVCLLDTLSRAESLGFKKRRIQEIYNDAIYYRDLARRDFQAGKINLREKACAENICLRILRRVAEIVPDLDRPPEELVRLCDSLADIYYGNFSVFQSLPDAWAIDQIFPVLPIHRLNEKPTRKAVVADLTCDCDGKLDQFGEQANRQKTLALHPLNANEDYYLGVFLVGAYQETLGDLHNLFGDTNVATVRINEQSQIEFVHEIDGDSISDVLRSVEYQPDRLYEQFRELAESAVKDGLICPLQRQQMLTLFTGALRANTYINKFS